MIQTVALYALPVIFAITLHEAAHGYAARHFGDNTAWMMGRVTLNPLKHIDPFGTILLPLILVLIGSPIILGAAKPVPVRFGNLRNPKRDMIWVALAGPAANIVMALAWGVGLYLLEGLGVTEPFFLKMCQGGVLVNVVLFAFNLFPLPPLDGENFSGPVAHQTGNAGLARGAVWFFHRDRPGLHRLRQHPVDAAPDGTHLHRTQLPALPLGCFDPLNHSLS